MSLELAIALVSPFLAAALTSWVTWLAVGQQLRHALHSTKKEATIEIAQHLLDLGGTAKLDSMGSSLLPTDENGKVLGRHRNAYWGMTIITVDTTEGQGKVAHVQFDFSRTEDLATNVAEALQNICVDLVIPDDDKLKLRQAQDGRLEKIKYSIDPQGCHILIGVLNIRELKHRQRYNRRHRRSR